MWFDETNYRGEMVLTLAIFRQLIALKGLWKVFENRQKKSLKVFEFFWSWRLRTLLYNQTLVCSVVRNYNASTTLSEFPSFAEKIKCPFQLISDFHDLHKRAAHDLLFAAPYLWFWDKNTTVRISINNSTRGRQIPFWTEAFWRHMAFGREAAKLYYRQIAHNY
jgi:hypothetical protein